MNPQDTQDFSPLLQRITTDRLEGLLSNVLSEMRRRDSKHLQGDAITRSQSLRMLRSSGKLP